MFTLLGAALALAAPVAPASSPGTGGDVALRARVGRVPLRDPACTGDACDAVRAENTQGVEAGLQVAGVAGLYAQVDHVHDAVRAADYAGDGWGAAGGVRLGIPLSATVGIHAWGELAYATTTADRGAATRLGIEAGAAVRVGDPLDGFVGWAGAAAAPWYREHATVLDGAVELDFAMPLPLQGVAGVQWISDPLGGPWDERGRISAGITGRVGMRGGVEGWLGVMF